MADNYLTIEEQQPERDSFSDPNILARIGETPTVNYLSPDVAYLGTPPNPTSPEQAWKNLKDFSGYTDISEGINQLGEGNYLAGAAQAGVGAASAPLPFAKGLALAKGAAELAPASLAAIGGMFYGKGARGANTLDLAKAQFGEAAAEFFKGKGNISPERAESIRQKTGWFRGPDNEWRFEGSDDLANIKVQDYITQQQAYSRAGGQGSSGTGIWQINTGAAHPVLSDLIDHPVAYANWPGLADIKVTETPGANAAASYNPWNDTIAISPTLLNDKDQLKSSLLHEIQHAIQTREGFGSGASVNEFLHPDYGKKAVAETDAFNDIVASARNTMNNRDIFQMLADIQTGKKSPSDFPDYASELSKYQDLYNETKDMRTTALDRYNRHAGEVEARLTQQRRFLTPEQRREITPFYKAPTNPLDLPPDLASVVEHYRKTRGASATGNPFGMDVPPLDQIVRHEPKRYNLGDLNPVARYFGNMFR
jgi:hypothetical protein